VRQPAAFSPAPGFDGWNSEVESHPGVFIQLTRFFRRVMAGT
jgi:hypothetical protein